MASPFDPTTQDGAVAPAAAPPTDAAALSPGFLDRLRSGERDAFVGFFEAHRVPVFNFARRFTQSGAQAAAVTREVFITTYRRILLYEGALEPRPLLYQAALALCRERNGASVDDDRLPRRASPDDDAVRATGRVELSRRFEQALQTLGDRHYVGLLLHDVHGLRSEEIATVLGLSAENGSTLLFHAREAFLRSFNELAADSGRVSCRLAEQVAASAVGRTLAADELRRLRDHAEYCRPCRKTMRSWGAGPIGLALFLTVVPLPRALDEAPVFAAAGRHDPTATAATAGETAIAKVGAVGAVAAMAAKLRRAVGSRAAAYALAAACLVAVAGMAVYVSQHDIRLVPEPVSVPTSLLVPPASHPQEHSATARAGRSGPAAKSSTTVSARKLPQTSGAGEQQAAVTASVIVARPTGSGGVTTSGPGSSSGDATTPGGGQPTSGGGQPAAGSGGQSGGGQLAAGSVVQPSGQSAVHSSGQQGSRGRAAANHSGRAKQQHSGGHPRSGAAPGSHSAAHTTSRQRGHHGTARATTRARSHHRTSHKATRHGSSRGTARTTTKAPSHHGAVHKTTGHGSSRGTAHKTTRHGGHHGSASRGSGHKHHGH